MKKLLSMMVVLFCGILPLSQFSIAQSGRFVASQTAPNQRQTMQTLSGIPLDTPWKAALYAFAQKNVVHASWGLPHAERNYHITLELALRSRVEVDIDVLFAASFLHDIGGLEGFEKKGVDHAVRSVEIAGPLLESVGFPMQKFTDVKDMILGHTYYGPRSQKIQSQFFREADILDFLGAIGVARLLAVTLEKNKAAPLISTVSVLEKFYRELPSQLLSAGAKDLGKTKIQSMGIYLNELKRETLGGRAL